MMATPSIEALNHPEWLGAWLGEQRVAFPTAAIHAVFSTQNNIPADEAIAPLDILVHAGVPVFLMPLTDWLPHHFESTTTLELAKSLPGHPGPWIVAFQPQAHDPVNATPCVGCRVHGIRGPFRANAHDGQVQFDGVEWPTWTPRRTT